MHPCTVPPPQSLKLADFGLAVAVREPLFTVCGTPTYVAPEILAETGYGVKVGTNWPSTSISFSKNNDKRRTGPTMRVFGGDSVVNTVISCKLKKKTRANFSMMSIFQT